MVMPAKNKVGELPIEILAKLPDGGIIKIGTAHVDLVVEPREQSANGTVYALRADFEEIRECVGAIFAAQQKG